MRSPLGPLMRVHTFRNDWSACGHVHNGSLVRPCDPDCPELPQIPGMELP